MYFGKNIKKIRSIKKLSQQAFAELFGLKRSSIGSYEEERADPKLEIIIKIAKHYNISVDNLVNKEITINELYNFHLPNEQSIEEQLKKNDLAKKNKIKAISLISSADILLKSLEHAKLESVSKISLPGLTENHIAIEINNNKLFQIPKHLKVNDIVIVDSKYELEDGLRTKDLFFLIKYESILSIAEIKQINKKEILLVSTDGIPVTIHKSKTEFILPIVKNITDSLQFNISESDRIKKLEFLVDDLYNRI